MQPSRPEIIRSTVLWKGKATGLSKLLELKRYSPHSLGSVNLECMGRCVKKKEKGEGRKVGRNGKSKNGG